jgi:hypothetical protein
VSQPTPKRGLVAGLYFVNGVVILGAVKWAKTERHANSSNVERSLD